jgi:integrase/recombinase XerC
LLALLTAGEHENRGEHGNGLAHVTPFQIRKFAAQLHAKGLNARSIARKLSAWRSFFAWLAEQTPLASNPVDGIRAPKRSKPLPKALSADDAVRLVAEAPPARDPAAPEQLCNKAMFELLYSSGLRVSELASLDVRYLHEDDYVSPGWIDTDAQEVVVTGKGGKQRRVPVGQPALQAIAAWLAVRGTLLKTDRRPLFVSARGTRISARVVQLRIKAHARALGIPADVHPHMLRHSFASHVLQSSGDLRAVQEMLGHASIAATQVYTSLDFQRLAQVYDAAHPRARKAGPNK